MAAIEQHTWARLLAYPSQLNGNALLEFKVALVRMLVAKIWSTCSVEDVPAVKVNQDGI